MAFDEKLFDEKSFDEVVSMKWFSIKWYGALKIYFLLTNLVEL
jgi:hypothetical protein